MNLGALPNASVVRRDRDTMGFDSRFGLRPVLFYPSHGVSHFEGH